MDPRFYDHAEVLVDDYLAVEAGENVLVQADVVAEDLVVALMEVLGERGANANDWFTSDRADRAYLRAGDDEFDVDDVSLAAAEEVDAYVHVRGGANTHATSDVPPETTQARRLARHPVQETLLDSKWVLTQYPDAAHAQQAGMSTEAYADFVFDAVCKDWDAQYAFQEPMVDVLDAASEVRLVSGEETDLRMHVDGMVAENDATHNNNPGGEVFTAPVPDSVEGTVHFDLPLMAHGREVRDVRLTFEDGEVVESAAAKNEDVLTNLLETDDGARRIGELGIGMNRDIDRFTYNMLFDEKMGDTVHLALGSAYEENVPEDRERNESAVHEDMIIDVSEDSVIEVDGEVVQRDGTFVFEDGFEAKA